MSVTRALIGASKRKILVKEESYLEEIQGQTIYPHENAKRPCRLVSEDWPRPWVGNLDRFKKSNRGRLWLVITVT